MQCSKGNDEPYPHPFIFVGLPEECFIRTKEVFLKSDLKEYPYFKKERGSEIEQAKSTIYKYLDKDGVERRKFNKTGHVRIDPIDITLSYPDIRRNRVVSLGDIAISKLFDTFGFVESIWEPGQDRTFKYEEMLNSISKYQYEIYTCLIDSNGDTNQITVFVNYEVTLNYNQIKEYNQFIPTRYLTLRKHPDLGRIIALLCLKSWKLRDPQPIWLENTLIVASTPLMYPNIELVRRDSMRIRGGVRNDILSIILENNLSVGTYLKKTESSAHLLPFNIDSGRSTYPPIYLAATNKDNWKFLNYLLSKRLRVSKEVAKLHDQLSIVIQQTEAYDFLNFQSSLGLVRRTCSLTRIILHLDRLKEIVGTKGKSQLSLTCRDQNALKWHRKELDRIGQIIKGNSERLLFPKPPS